MSAVAHAFVLQAMHKQTIEWFVDPSVDPRVRHAVATVHKVTLIGTAQAANLTLGDRCGAQGLFEANQLSAVHVWSFRLDPSVYAGCSLGVINL